MSFLDWVSVGSNDSVWTMEAFGNLIQSDTEIALELQEFLIGIKVTIYKVSWIRWGASVVWSILHAMYITWNSATCRYIAWLIFLHWCKPTLREMTRTEGEKKTMAAGLSYLAVSNWQSTKEEELPVHATGIAIYYLCIFVCSWACENCHCHFWNV